MAMKIAAGGCLLEPQTVHDILGVVDWMLARLPFDEDTVPQLHR
jgi:hypothetical protein